MLSPIMEDIKTTTHQMIKITRSELSVIPCTVLLFVFMSGTDLVVDEV